mmetsp:Transcript_15453/g.13491  ORF Transcript_15453/g.13491 Transcript_15453/m.13491 type:complete len:96 (-) Transcript_15453:67-354(-)
MGNCCSNSPNEKDSNIEMIDENKNATSELDSDGGAKDTSLTPKNGRASREDKKRENKKPRKERDADSKKKKKSRKDKKEKKERKSKRKDKDVLKM